MMETVYDDIVHTVIDSIEKTVTDQVARRVVDLAEGSNDSGDNYDSDETIYVASS